MSEAMGLGLRLGLTQLIHRTRVLGIFFKNRPQIFSSICAFYVNSYLFHMMFECFMWSVGGNGSQPTLHRMSTWDRGLSSDTSTNRSLKKEPDYQTLSRES